MGMQDVDFIKYSPFPLFSNIFYENLKMIGNDYIKLKNHYVIEEEYTKQILSAQFVMRTDETKKELTADEVKKDDAVTFDALKNILFKYPDKAKSIEIYVKMKDMNLFHLFKEFS